MMYPRTLIALCTAAIAVLYAFWLLRFGVKWGGDVAMYSGWADALIAHRFHYDEYLSHVKYGIPTFLYLTWVTVVAITKLVAGNEWEMLLIGLNWGAVVMTAWLVLTTVWRQSSSTIALIVATVFFANFDLLDFVGFPLSDILFAGGVAAILIMSLHVSERPATPLVLGGTIAVVIACFFRPTAAPVAAVWVIALLWPRLPRRRIVPVIGILILAAIFVQAALMQDLTLWPGSTPPGWLEGLRDNYHHGVIVNGRPESNTPPPAHYLDFVAMIFRRWWYFFAITMPGYSTRHTIVNMLFYVPAYGLALAAVFLRRSAATTLLSLLILLISAFHGMVTIDFDHRYRLPMLPALIMLAALGSSVPRFAQPSVPPRTEQPRNP